MRRGENAGYSIFFFLLSSHCFQKASFPLSLKAVTDCKGIKELSRPSNNIIMDP